MLNPEAETNYKFHIGMPLFSGFAMDLGLKGFALKALFADNNISINDKVASFLNKIDVDAHLCEGNFLNRTFNGGFRLADKTYMSVGLYGELDGIGYFPKDAITLLNEGNDTYLNKSFNFSKLVYRLDILSVFHAGFTRKVDEKLTFGVRFKIYASVANVASTNNKATFTTRIGANNLYTHYLNNIDVGFKTSGIKQNNAYIKSPEII